MVGSLAERTYVDTYVMYSFLMTGLIFPIACAWTWGQGWLNDIGFHDYAGSGVIHLVGGIPGLIGTIILGPRLGIYGFSHLEKGKIDKSNKNAKK